MHALAATGLDDPTVTVPPQDLAALAERLDGTMAFPGSDDYDESTTIWNAMATKRPSVVVRAQSSADVVAVVNFAVSTESSCRSRGAGTTSPGWHFPKEA